MAGRVTGRGPSSGRVSIGRSSIRVEMLAIAVRHRSGLPAHGSPRPDGRVGVQFDWRVGGRHGNLLQHYRVGGFVGHAPEQIVAGDIPAEERQSHHADRSPGQPRGLLHVRERG